jgi:hypothetical protein
MHDLWRHRADLLRRRGGVRERWLLRRNQVRRQREHLLDGTGLHERDMPAGMRESRTGVLRWQVPERRLLRDRCVLRGRCAMPESRDSLFAREYLCGVRRCDATLLRGKRLQRHDQGYLPDRRVQCLRRLRSAVLCGRGVPRRQNVSSERNVSLALWLSDRGVGRECGLAVVLCRLGT